MNTFNAFQAVGFYTMLPLATQWMFANNYSVWGYILSESGLIEIGEL